jgi:hypothetical protein
MHLDELGQALRQIPIVIDDHDVRLLHHCSPGIFLCRAIGARRLQPRGLEAGGFA